VSLEFTDDGKRLASAAADLAVRLWDVADVRLIATFLDTRDHVVVGSLRFDATGQRLLAPTTFEVRIFSAADPEIALAMDDVSYPQLFRDGGRFGAGAPAGYQVRSMATGEPLERLEVPRGTRTVLSPDNTKLASFVRGNPTDVEVRDLATRAVITRFHPAGRTIGLEFDHAGARLATGSSEGVVELWNLRGERLMTLRGHRGLAMAVAFSPDDGRVVSGSFDGTARVWDLASGREILQLKTERLGSVRFDATGTRVLTCGTARAVQLWDAATGVVLRSFEGPSEMSSATIDARGTLIAGASVDGTVSVWDVASSSLVAQFHHASRGEDVAFSPGGDRLLSTDDEGRAFLWRLDLETRRPDEVARFVRCRAPYKLVETRLATAAPVCAGD